MGQPCARLTSYPLYYFSSPLPYLILYARKQFLQASEVFYFIMWTSMSENCTRSIVGVQKIIDWMIK